MPAEIRAGQRVLDVAAGSSNAAIPGRRARRHRRRVGPDAGTVRRRAGDRRPCSTTLASTPSSRSSEQCSRHRQTADEMLRVCRPGGTIAMINWTP
jgi:2-polyprenyl-6-hydroxyphenyl methylase/3-demethylubiquinone-9 3-methyltransferase